MIQSDSLSKKVFTQTPPQEILRRCLTDWAEETISSAFFVGQLPAMPVGKAFATDRIKPP